MKTMKSLKHLTLMILVGPLLLAATLQTQLAEAQLSELYAFQYNANTTSNYPDGQTPLAELIQGADGNYYTTTFQGGSGACPSDFQGVIAGCGTVVKITPAGQLTVVYSFPYDSSNSTAPNGMYSEAGLLQGPDGNFYGTTVAGGTEGTNFCVNGQIFGCGTIFKLTPGGALTVLHDFCGGYGCTGLATDGVLPLGRLALGPDGNLYGTTEQGGFYDGLYNQGTIFRISLSGAYSIVHLFTGGVGTGDGEDPGAGLTLGSDGNFYGTTEAGGTSQLGTVFKMNLAGAVKILHSFSGSDGQVPWGALVQASDGNFYGTCYGGGANAAGSVFRISESGSFLKLYDFDGIVGAYPRAGLIQASDGNLYGATGHGGSGGLGAIYQITLAGVATQEASFTGNTGWAPVDALVQGSDGQIYLTQQNDGGSNGQGVQDSGAIDVFNAGLAPPKPGIFGFAPSSGKVGAKVTLGFGPYIGATSVKFNGTSATFKVTGSEFVTATVPAGTTTGTISVTTPGGTATSTKMFTVVP